MKLQARHRQIGTETGMLLTNPDVAEPMAEDVLSRDLVYSVIPKVRWGLSLMIWDLPALHTEITGRHRHWLRYSNFI